jgi:hypothetical protein
LRIPHQAELVIRVTHIINGEPTVELRHVRMWASKHAFGNWKQEPRPPAQWPPLHGTYID